MTTKQEEIKELIGHENYEKLISASYFPIEIDTLKVLLTQHEKLVHLEVAMKQLEEVPLVEDKEPSSAQERLPDIDIDYQMTKPKKPIPKDYHWQKDMAYQVLEDEAVSLNVEGAKLYINPSSARGGEEVQEGELLVCFMEKRNRNLVKSLKEHDWNISKFRIADEESKTGKASMIQARKYIKLRYEMGYEPRKGDIR